MWVQSPDSPNHYTHDCQDATSGTVCSLLHVPSSSLHLGALLNEAARESPDTYQYFVEIKLDAENESALESSLYLVYIYLGRYTKSLAINQTSSGPLLLLKPLWLKVHLSS